MAVKKYWKILRVVMVITRKNIEDKFSTGGPLDMRILGLVKTRISGK